MYSKYEINQAVDKAYQILQPWSKEHEHEKFYYRKVIKLLSSFYNQDNNKIIDLGSGIGILSLALIFLGNQVEGMEKYIFSDVESSMFKPDDLDNLKQVWQQNNFKVNNFDITQSLPDQFVGKYDVVINTAVIEHLKSPKLFLQNINFMLKPSGIVITMTPNLVVFYKRLRFLCGFSPNWNLFEFFNTGDNFAGHWREYSMKELKSMHEWLDFKIIFAQNCDIFSLFRKKTLRNVWHLFVRYISIIIPNSREANFVVARKI